MRLVLELIADAGRVRRRSSEQARAKRRAIFVVLQEDVAELSEGV